MTVKHVIVDGVECKVCPACHVKKPLSEFGKNRHMKDGLNTYCKVCHNANTMEGQRRRRTRGHSILVWLGNTEYAELDDLAKYAKMDTGGLARAIILDWLDTTRGGGKEVGN